MASKTFEEILNSRPEEERKKFEQTKNTVVSSDVVETVGTQTIPNPTISTDTPKSAPVVEGQVDNSIAAGAPQVSDPNAVKQEGQTLADNGLKPTPPVQGNSSTFSEIANKPTTAATPPQDSDSLQPKV